MPSSFRDYPDPPDNPDKNDPFVRRESCGVPYYVCRALEELAFLRHGFSTRQGGVSPPARQLNLSATEWDVWENVRENRRRFLAALRLGDVPLVTLSQIHSARVHTIDEKQTNLASLLSSRANSDKPEGDALVTEVPHAALGIQVADCFPLLIADKERRAVAAVHAGWRGTHGRIVSQTIKRMRKEFDSDPRRLVAAIGPGIRECCYEVGAEVATAFEDVFPNVRVARESTRASHYLLDLRAALGAQFAESGVIEENVHDLGLCTRCHAEKFFSFRKQGTRAGRLMAVIARVDPS